MSDKKPIPEKDLDNLRGGKGAEEEIHVRGKEPEVVGRPREPEIVIGRGHERD